MFALLKAAATKAKSNDPVKIAYALEGLKLDTPLGPMEMRADNHQLLQPLFVSTLSDKVTVRRGAQRPGLRHRREDPRERHRDAHDLQDAAALDFPPLPERAGPRCASSSSSRS